MYGSVSPIVGLLGTIFESNRVSLVKSMKLGTHVKHPLLIIFRYGPMSAAPPGDHGGHNG